MALTTVLRKNMAIVIDDQGHVSAIQDIKASIALNVSHHITCWEIFVTRKSCALMTAVMLGHATTITVLVLVCLIDLAQAARKNSARYIQSYAHHVMSRSVCHAYLGTTLLMTTRFAGVAMISILGVRIAQKLEVNNLSLMLNSPYFVCILYITSSTLCSCIMKNNPRNFLRV